MAGHHCPDQRWGYLANDVTDAPACISDCRQRFLKALLPQPETFEGVCERLSDKSDSSGGTGVKDEPFWALYCCGSQRCGVDNLENGGEDPNVNWVINTCQNAGYDSVFDPGPPKESYKCNSERLLSEDPRCQKLHATSQNTSKVELSGTIASSTSSPESTSMATSTQSSLNDPSLSASLNPNTSDAHEDPRKSGGLSTGVKVTIGLSALAGVLVIALITFCVLRYRRRPPHRRPQFGQLIKRDASPAQADSPTPLVSPTISHTGPDGAPLTPPPPLKERKMLDTSAGSRPSSAGQSRTRAGFPTSPVFAPTASKLIPRSERIARARGAATSPPTSPLGWMTTTHDSIESSSSYPTNTASVIFASNSAERVTELPMRLQRSLDATYDIPSPGPPPTRALPSTPPSGPVTQPSTAASSIRHGDIGVAIGVVTHNPANGVVLGQESRDLCEMTEQYGLDTRDSWDSWTGGGPGPVETSKTKGMQSPVMQEHDLERLGGRY